MWVQKRMHRTMYCLKSDQKCTELCQCFGQSTNGRSCWFVACLTLVLKKSTDWYYKGVSTTSAIYKVKHYMKNHEIWAFFNTYFPAFVQNRRFCTNTGKWIWLCSYTGKYGLEKARIWAYFTQWSSLWH